MTALVLVGLGGYLAGAVTFLVIVWRGERKAERKQIRRYLRAMRF